MHHNIRTAYHRQAGSMLVIALFVVVVLSLLGLIMTQLFQASSDRVIQEVYGLRALNAAQSGIERKISAAFPLQRTAGPAATCNDDNEVFNFTDVQGLENCFATTRCIQTNFNTDNITYFRFVSQGTCQGGKVIANRTVAVDARIEN